jgi:hypothetical protein
VCPMSTLSSFFAAKTAKTSDQFVVSCDHIFLSCLALVVSQCTCLV